MEIDFNCHGCGLQLAAPIEMAGLHVRCDHCDVKQEVPASSQEISFACGGCARSLSAPINYVGCKVRCDHCETKMLVPKAGDEARIIEETKIHVASHPTPLDPVDVHSPEPEQEIDLENIMDREEVSHLDTEDDLEVEDEWVEETLSKRAQNALKNQKSRSPLPIILVLIFLLGGGAFFAYNSMDKSGDSLSQTNEVNLDAPVELGPVKEPEELNQNLEVSEPLSQNNIEIVDRMVQMPKPLVMRDWLEVSQKYYQYIMRPGYELDGHLLMQVQPRGKNPGQFAISANYLQSRAGKKAWDCEFYDNMEFAGTASVSRLDEDVNFNWKHGKPLDEIAHDRFTVRWSTTLQVPESRTYKFFLKSDDGSRLSIDGKQVMGKLDGLVKTSHQAQLEKGKEYKLVVEYKEVSGDAYVYLNWDYQSAEEFEEMKRNTTFDLRMPSYRHSKPGGEIFTNVSSVVGAKMVGLDPVKLVGFDILKSVKLWFDEKHGLYRHGPGQKSPELHSGIYGYWSSVYGVMLADLFPEDPDFLNQVKASTNAFLTIAKGLGCPDNPNFDTLGFNFETNGPGGRKEPMNRYGNSPIVAWMNLLGYQLQGNEEMLECARSAMRYYTENPGRYELTHVMAPYVASKLNAEHGDQFDLALIYDVWFGGGGEKKIWQITAGEEFDGVTVDGLDGAIWKSGNFLCFTMGSLNGPAWLLPALRYDQTYARALAKYSLNMANSMRLMQGHTLDWNRQDHKDWKDRFDPEFLLFYEALGSSEFSDKRMYSPNATGDPIRLGWGTPKVERKDYLAQKKEWFSKTSNNLGMYMGNHVGLLGAICEKTNVEGVLRWDCLKTEWLHEEAHPTFLYWNPHETSQEVSIRLSDKLKGPVDVYDSVSQKFVATALTSGQTIKMEADQAMVLVMVPQGAKISHDGSQLSANGIVIDYQLK
ncbi:beta-glucosidase [Lentisphaera araneosa HTCC2155]|uniref:Beta-glucosidase n=1 Tax=Lentisphaera araneosa HTCC2155 TaxID=313628 RepID=A6DPF0_9BACT|nr:PA14 domain-containing protein [Lentisphaera araneosa]EDM26446.1 beta-glucosidase [Lentisphaera araneosa HTCC2155]